jgi:hypothetical protein
MEVVRCFLRIMGKFPSGKRVEGGKEKLANLKIRDRALTGRIVGIRAVDDTLSRFPR